MLQDAKNLLDNVKDEIDEAKDKVIETLFEKLPALIDKWDFESRSLTPHEIAEARKVFGDGFDYKNIKIYEGNELPNFLDDIGNIIKKMPKREERTKNAITLGNWCMFGRKLATERPHDMSWMIHELTHAWQYQTMGWDYLFQALDAQKKLGAKAYDFGGEDGLKKQMKKGSGFKDFNLEQQGDIAKNYYLRLTEGQDTDIWEHYMKQVR